MPTAESAPSWRHLPTAEGDRVRKLLHDGRTKQAIAEARRLVAEYDGSPQTASLLTEILVGAQQWKEAVAAADQAIAIQPAWNWLHRLRAIALRQLGRVDESVVSAQEAVRLEPFEPANPLHEAFSLKRAKRHAEAAAALADVLALDPDHIDGHAACADLFDLTGHLDRVEAHLRHLFSKRHLRPNALRKMAKVMRARGSSGDARALERLATIAEGKRPSDLAPASRTLALQLCGVSLLVMGGAIVCHFRPGSVTADQVLLMAGVGILCGIAGALRLWPLPARDPLVQSLTAAGVSNKPRR